jgi:hypothetical protein
MAEIYGGYVLETKAEHELRHCRPRQDAMLASPPRYSAAAGAGIARQGALHAPPAQRGDFRRGYSLHNDKVRRAPRWTGQIQAGRGGRLMELGVHVGERRVHQGTRGARRSERDSPLAEAGAPPRSLSRSAAKISKYFSRRDLQGKIGNPDLR